MTVYVDDVKIPYGRSIMCHMLADTEEELHDMAQKIGLHRSWFQNTRLPHYDIALGKRALAVDNGAIEVTSKEIGCMLGRKRVIGSMGTPDEAVKWFHENYSVIEGD